jgi:hypothetical protein
MPLNYFWRNSVVIEVVLMKLFSNKLLKTIYGWLLKVARENLEFFKAI